MDSTLLKITSYFDAGGSLERLRRLSLPADEVMPDRTYCHIVPVLPPLCKQPALNGFSSPSNKPRRPTATLFIKPTAGKEQIGVSMIREDGSWSFRPCIIGDLNPKGFLVPFDLPWAEVLGRLSAKALVPLLKFQSSNPYIDSGIRNEINARKLTFDYRGPFEFFSQQGDGLAWVVSSLWHSWEQEHISQHERLDQLCSLISHNLNSLEYLELHPQAVAKKLARKEIILPNFIGAPQPSIVSFTQSTSSAINEANKFAIETQMKSVGECVKFRRSSVTTAKQSRTEAERHFMNNGFWWWRDLASQPDFFREFATKWETSAFFYEFRARQNKNRKLNPSWDWSGTPWLNIDNTQRGILYCLCPPANIVKRQKTLLKLAPKRKNIYSCEIYLARPFDEVLAEVRMLWEHHEVFFHFGESAEGKKLDRLDETPPKRSKPKLSSKWTLLEDLDVLQFMGNSAPRLSSSQQILLRRKQNEYRLTCEHAGLLP